MLTVSLGGQVTLCVSGQYVQKKSNSAYPPHVSMLP